MFFFSALLHTEYESKPQLLFWKVTLVASMDSCRNSHSPWVLINSRENSVAREEFEKGKNCISSTVEGGKKINVRAQIFKNKNVTILIETHWSVVQNQWLCCIPECQRGTYGRPSCRCSPPVFPLQKTPSHRKTPWDTHSEGIRSSVSWHNTNTHWSVLFLHL